MEPSRSATPGAAEPTLRVERRQVQRQGTRRQPEVRMVPGTVRNAGRRLRFAISDNELACGPDGPGSPPIWAINIHGYFAGGQMYNRESAVLAARLGWRLVNPSLPGFGGSDPLAWDEASMPRLADQVATLLSHLDTGPVVLLGHSMGGAVAVQFAYDHPDETLGIIYRDGVATPAWRHRHNFLTAALAPLIPDAAPLLGLLGGIAVDVPDLMMGRLYSTVRSLMPDVRRNIHSLNGILPIGSMLMTTDLRREVRALVAQNLPILPVWGCFDRVANEATAVEFGELTRQPVQWVPGGHSWMLARPQGQAAVLRHVDSGRRFVASVEDRWRRRTSADRSLRALP